MTQTVPPVAAERPWTFDGAAGREWRSEHYRLATTVTDDAVTGRLLRVLEAGYGQYAALLPPDPRKSLPLDAFLFARADQWEAFTRRLTGPDAGPYLSVGRGGYAYGDRFVCRRADPDDLWPVVAHEAFHQYVARHLGHKLPPALEEGLATTFESVRVDTRSVTFDTRSNPRREQGLRDAGRAGALLPLATLVRLNAADVAGRPAVVREGFYGQCWLLADVLESDARYAAGLRSLLRRLADGGLTPMLDVPGDPRAYVPGRAEALLVGGLGVPWERIEADYRAKLAEYAVVPAGG